MLEHVPVTLDTAGSPRLERHGHYLITGGLRGIGLEIATSLAHSHAARLVLTSRHGLPPREEWATIAAEAQSNAAPAMGIGTDLAALAETLDAKLDGIEHDLAIRTLED